MIVNECKSLTERFAAKRQAGLVDVKFYVNHFEGADLEGVIEDAVRLQAAIDDGALVEDFAFNDRHTN